MKSIFLIRHCQAEGQAPDAQLTTLGQEQSMYIADFLNDFSIDYIVSSPYERAYRTIEPLASRRSLSIHTDIDLQERVLSQENLPDWLEKLRLTFDDLDLRYTGGESSRQAMDRGIAVLDKAIRIDAKQIAVVSHGNLISLLLKHYDEQIQFEHWQALSNPDVYQLVFDDEYQLIRMQRIWQ
ncbi:2,3-bisphosphoglycerate-dependent phosphoglycerate mutase [Paenibacillus sp. SORGH_AS306]|uniref:histidine phosphatase family protein n=1 Tax=unclassified Paenibacillus TaxID=185978 RepID=UPI002789A328|nr:MULTISPECIES: histidine phosphatase family protein [unclassified Paenibacillus]MDQ1232705.1 2,3-bisphosphoglycerate-dependent phosphoglycerate mutase [Paenibacillus sp. SORGH_AS_0306]MDR6109755.1 2,3-bisphosphoglycerate-dependent phosphoglycerate mutase [Paenibacillus sp. SORGH_AS_0338]